MYISNLKLWNFRKFGTNNEISADSPPNLNLNFTNGLNVIIGENDSGKTAIIDALKLVLKTHSYDYIKVDDRDFHELTSNFRIEIVFIGLKPDEAKNFTEWLGWTGIGDKVEPYLKINYDVKRQDKRIFPADVKAGVDFDGYQLTAEAREYLKTTYLKPLRDAENELIAKRNSRLSQILLGDSAFKGKEKDHELVKIFEGLSDELKKYFKGEFKVKLVDEKDEQTYCPQEGKIIKDKIDGYIKNFYGTEYETYFEATSNDIKSILEKLALSLQNEQNPGLGTLNRLFMAAELLHLNKTIWSGIRLGLVEELEAHLHPQAQMQVIEALQKQEAIQFIIATHSPNIASKIRLDNLIICNSGSAFPMGSDYTKLEPSDYKFLEKFLDTTKSNLFFAKGVILVEGWAEEILLPSIAKNIGIDLTKKGVSVINIGNLGFIHYINIFLRKNTPHMSIPVSVITDVDVKEYEKIINLDTEGKPEKDINGKNTYEFKKIEESITKGQIDKQIEKLSLKDEQTIRYFIAPKWTFEYCLYHSTSLSTIFQEVVKTIHSGSDWNTNFEKSLAEKLINKGLNKTEIAYKIAQAMDEDLSSCEKKDEKTKVINIKTDDANDTINYLIKAIKHASGN